VTDDIKFTKNVHKFIKERNFDLDNVDKYIGLGFTNRRDQISNWLTRNQKEKNALHAFRVFADILERLEIRSDNFEIDAPTAAPRILRSLGFTHLLVDCHVNVRQFMDSGPVLSPGFTVGNIFCQAVFPKVNTILDIVNDMFSTVSVFWSSPVSSPYSYQFLYSREFFESGERPPGLTVTYEINHSREYGIHYDTRYEDDSSDSLGTRDYTSDFDDFLEAVETPPEFDDVCNSPQSYSTSESCLDRPYTVGCVRFPFIIKNRSEGSRRINTLLVEKSITDSLSNYIILQG